MEIKVDANTKEIKKLLKSVSPKIVTPSLVQAINTAVRGGKSSAIKATAKTTGVKQKAIRKRITGGNKGSAKANRKKLSSMLFIRTNVGIKASEALNKGALKKVQTRNSFFAEMPSGKRGIWERTGQRKTVPKQGRYKGKISSRGQGKGRPIRREPIAEILIPLHPLGTNAASRAYRKRVNEDLPKELQRQILRRVNAQAARNKRSN